MQPSAPSGSVSQELGQNAQQLSTSAVNRAHGEIDARKGEAATQARSVSTAIEQAAGSLDPNAPAWLKSAFQQGSQQLQRFADAVEQKDSRQLVSDVSDFARTSPGTFLAGCAAVGFAAARIFKAGSSDDGQAGSQGMTAMGGQNASFGTSSSGTQTSPNSPTSTMPSSTPSTSSNSAFDFESSSPTQGGRL